MENLVVEKKFKRVVYIRNCTIKLPSTRKVSDLGRPPLTIFCSPLLMYDGYSVVIISFSILSNIESRASQANAKRNRASFEKLPNHLQFQSTKCLIITLNGTTKTERKVVRGAKKNKYQNQSFCLQGHLCTIKLHQV